MAEFLAYTDGACSGNPGPGGWGVLLQAYEDGALLKEKEISGGARDATNNQMELKAAIEALKALSKPTKITILTDSVYVKDGITKWISSWKARGWKTASKKPVKNIELWQELDDLAAKHDVNWQWVKGHAGEEGNERVDELATNEVKKLKAD